MKILFLSNYFYPHIGGVETHALEIAKILAKNGNEVSVITEKYRRLEKEEIHQGIKIYRFTYPHTKLFGIISIWWWMFQNKHLIKNVDVVQCHDVFIWYLPFRFLFPFKKVYTTFHGWEGVWPIPFKNKFIKKLSWLLSKGSIGIGKYVGKYYGIKPDFITYGGVEKIDSKFKKEKGSVIFLGRLEKDTCVFQFIEDIKNKKFKKIIFVGDGKYRTECSKYGYVTGYASPEKYLKKAEYCVPGGYLSYLAAKAYGCKIITFADNPLKKDYWSEIKSVRNFQSWNDVETVYEKLWKLHD